MARVDKPKRTITVQLLVWGAQGSGKSAVIAYLGDVAAQNTGTRPARRGSEERLRVPMGSVRGFELNAEFFTSDADVKSVLETADGVYFVADSRSGSAAANAQALSKLEQGFGAEPPPMVMLYNKADLPDDQLCSETELRETLNARRVPDFRGVATTGPGVSHLAMQLINHVLKRL